MEWPCMSREKHPQDMWFLGYGERVCACPDQRSRRLCQINKITAIKSTDQTRDQQCLPLQTPFFLKGSYRIYRTGGRLF